VFKRIYNKIIFSGENKTIFNNIINLLTKTL